MKELIKRLRTTAPKADQSGDATEMAQKAEQHEPALLLWRAICEEAECVVLPGSAGGKRLMLTEEMCQRLGAAIESTPPDLAAENARLRAELEAAYEPAETTARRQLARIEELMAQQAAAQKDAERLNEILRDHHMPECYRIQISKGDYHYRKLIPPEQAFFIGEIAKDMVAAIAKEKAE